MNESQHNSGGIDPTFDETTIKTVDVNVLKLATIIAIYITKHRDEFTDLYYDMIMNAVENINGVNHLTLNAYSNYILNVTFSYAGRIHYDDIREIVIKFCQAQMMSSNK